jgi:hypothetical protein
VAILLVAIGLVVILSNLRLYYHRLFVAISLVTI